MLIFNIIWAIWMLSEVLLTIIVRSGKSDKKGQDKGTLAMIWIVIFVAMFSGIFISNNWRFIIANSNLVLYTGLSVIVIGMLIRFYAIWLLGRLFTVNVTIREGHTVKKDGIYRMVRHPSYSGSLLSFVGFGLSLNNWISLFTITIPVAAAFIYRIKIEERLLIAQFGDDYLDYKKETYYLIPWIY